MWTRNNTKSWISQLEYRITDIQHYLNQTNKWCEDNYIFDKDKIFICNFITCIWVSYQRNEIITYSEVLEILGIDDICVINDKFYELNEDYKNLDHIDMLISISKSF